MKIINKWKNSAEFKNTNFGVFQAGSHSNKKVYFVLIYVCIFHLVCIQKLFVNKFKH